MLKAAADQVAVKMLKNPKGIKQIDSSRALRKNTEWAWLTNAFGQPFAGWDPGQLAYLYRLYEFWVMGELAITRLPIDCAPYGDRQRQANQAALNALELLSTPEGYFPGFSAWVNPDQKTSGYGDGQLRWEQPIEMGIRIPGEPYQACGLAKPPISGVPLEIGSTDTTTSYMHLLQGVGLARWAYGSTSVILMVPSTFISEVWRPADPTVRWKPKATWNPSDQLRPEPERSHSMNG
jgi:hypothetical protein